MSIQEKMEDDGITLLQGITATNGHILNLPDGNVGYEDIIEAQDLLKKDNEEQGIRAFFMANHVTVKGIRKSERFVNRESLLGDRVLTSGVVGAIAGCNVIISNRLTNNEAYILMFNRLYEAGYLPRTPKRNELQAYSYRQ
jgi:hypothetical protein